MRVFAYQMRGRSIPQSVHRETVSLYGFTPDVEATVCATVVEVENATFPKLVGAAETNWPVLAEDDYCGMAAATDDQVTALECR
jgi:hypothetical protein